MTKIFTCGLRNRKEDSIKTISIYKADVLYKYVYNRIRATAAPMHEVNGAKQKARPDANGSLR